MVVNKFGKLCGPGAESVPTANSVTTDKIFDGTIAAGDLGALSVTAAKLGVDVAGDGLAGGNGAAISLDIDNLTDAVLDVAADTICFIDESADGDPTKLEAVADVATAMAGTGLAATNGVLSASGIGIAHMANDDKASLFFMGGEIDFGVSAAVTVDLGALGSKATLLGGHWYTTEAVTNGDATNVITLGSATGGGVPIAGTRTITLANTGDGQSNVIGSMAAVIPVAAGIDMAASDHVWLDIPDDATGTRDAGKVAVFLIFQKSA